MKLTCEHDHHMKTALSQIPRLTISLMAASLVSFLSQAQDRQITSGPNAGRSVRGLSSKAEPRLISGETNLVQMVSFSMHPSQTNVPVALAAYHHRCVILGGQRDEPVDCFELEIRDRQSGLPLWSCWAPVGPHPHRFQVRTLPSGESYACFIAGGVYLFRIVVPRDPERTRAEFWNETPDPDALPALTEKLLLETVGRTNMLGAGPTAWNIVMDDVTRHEGELRVTLHGGDTRDFGFSDRVALIPRDLAKCTYALRGTNWVFVSRN